MNDTTSRAFQSLKCRTDCANRGQSQKSNCSCGKIFRGKRYKDPVEIYSVSYKPDYRLIPKDEEQLWWDRVASSQPREKVVPGSVELPPLMRLVLERDNKDFNSTLPLEIRTGRDNVAQVDVTKIASYKTNFSKSRSTE